MIEVLLPVALGLMGSGVGYWLSRKQRHWRLAALIEADRLREAGKLPAAAVLLEQALRNGGTADTAFAPEALYRLAGIYANLGRWTQGEATCRELLAGNTVLGHSGRHDLLRHLARCLEGLGQSQERELVLAEADALIEQIADTAYRLFARQERLVRQRRYAEALLIQEELLQHHPERISLPTLLIVTACPATNAGYPRQALPYLNQALSLSTLDYTLQREARRSAILAAERASDWVSLGLHAQGFLELTQTQHDPKFLPEARVAAARARLLRGDLAGAEELADNAPILLLTIARLRGDFPAAQALLATLSAPQEGLALLHAALSLESGDGAEALHQLDLILPTPELPLWVAHRRRARRAWALALLGRDTEARAELTALPTPSPETETELICQEACAFALYYLGDRSEAISTLSTLVTNPALAPVFASNLTATLTQWKTNHSTPHRG